MSNLTTKVTCPNCGTEFKIADKTTVTVGVVIGKDSNLGEIHPEVENGPKPQKPKAPKAVERINALKAAGVDVSNLFAVEGVSGDDFIVRNVNGELRTLDESDPIFDVIRQGGNILNRKLFRRWVMAQMFRMLYSETNPGKGHASYAEKLRSLGYDYQWKMLEDELYAQRKMFYHDDMESYKARNRWFNKEVVVQMAREYSDLLTLHIENLPVRKCKGVPYKHIGGRNVFVDDIYNKVMKSIYQAVNMILCANTPEELYRAVATFNRNRISLDRDAPQHKAWVDAYKGSGAYFTLFNMLFFHGCILRGRNGKMLSKHKSLRYLEEYAEECSSNKEGYKMLGVLRQALKDNHIDIDAKFKEWAKKYRK